MANEGKWRTVAGYRVYVVDGRILFGEGKQLNTYYNLWIYRVDKKDGKLKPIDLQGISISAFRRGVKDGTIKLKQY